MSGICPNCGSERTRRGGYAIWSVYLAVITAAVIAVLAFHLHAGLVAASMLAAVVAVNLAIDQRVCSDCGLQWTKRRATGR